MVFSFASAISDGMAIAIAMFFGAFHMPDGFAGLCRVSIGLAMVTNGAVLVALTIGVGG
jgi:hypothetical protein